MDFFEFQQNQKPASGDPRPRDPQQRQTPPNATPPDGRHASESPLSDSHSIDAPTSASKSKPKPKPKPARSTRSRAVTQPPLPGLPGNAGPSPDAFVPWTVAELTSRIDRAIKSGLPSTLHVRGELSNVKHHGASGHIYFTLKDNAATIDGVMFRADASRLKFTPRDGMELLITGRVSIYAQRGRYQLYATAMQPLGQGALELAFQELRKKLSAEGLFDPSRKRPMPTYPRHIALVTGRSTAALADMLKVLRRFRWLKIYLYPVLVQGEGAGDKIADALRLISRQHAQVGGIDVILLGRGGGSLEDLWAFNEEPVARAIYESAIPIITGIGHEVDVSISDLVADYHAHTPTEAAQVAVAGWKNSRDLLDAHGIRLRRELRTILAEARQRLNAIEVHEIFRRPTDRIGNLRQFLDDRQKGLLLAMARQLAQGTSRIENARRRLDQHRPSVILASKVAKLDDASRRLARAMALRLRREESILITAGQRLGAHHPQHAVRLSHERLAQLRQRLSRAMAGEIARQHQSIQIASRRLEAHRPQQTVRLFHEQLNLLQGRLARAMSGQIAQQRRGIDALAQHLRAIGPEQVLQRGYSLTISRKTGQVIRDAAQLRPGDHITTRLANGQVQSTVDDDKQPRLFE